MDKALEIAVRAHCNHETIGELRCQYPACRCDCAVGISDTCAAILAALEAAGLRIVPVEPSEAMKRAGTDAITNLPMNTAETHPVGGWGAETIAVYRAMLAAAEGEDGKS